jgi:hypothetical protein
VGAWLDSDLRPPALHFQPAPFRIALSHGCSDLPSPISEVRTTPSCGHCSRLARSRRLARCARQIALFGHASVQRRKRSSEWGDCRPPELRRDTLSYLCPASQLGLALYMFVVGLKFRMDMVRKHLKSSVAVSVTEMAAPFAQGAGHTRRAAPLARLLASWHNGKPRRAVSPVRLCLPPLH